MDSISELAKVRRSLGISIRSLASEAGLPYSTVRRADRGQAVSQQAADKILRSIEIMRNKTDSYSAGPLPYKDVNPDSDEHTYATGKEIESIRDIYTQSNFNMRAFIFLRFRHFAIFSVVLGFIATAAFRIDTISTYRTYFLSFGIVITILFWILDYRSSQYLSYYAKKSDNLEAFFIEYSKINVSMPKRERPYILSASATTNIIFGIICIAWASFTLFDSGFLSKINQNADVEIHGEQVKSPNKLNFISKSCTSGAH